MLKNNLAKACLIALSLTSSIFPKDALYVGASMGETSSHFSLDRDLAIGRKDFSNIGKDSFNCGLFVGYNYLIKETPIFEVTDDSLQVFANDMHNYRWHTYVTLKDD